MIDLKELEKRLDDALANETTESLTSWIFDQRRDNLESFLGLGCIQQFKVSPFVFNQGLSLNAQYNCSNENNPSTELAKAA